MNKEKNCVKIFLKNDKTSEWHETHKQL